MKLPYLLRLRGPGQWKLLWRVAFGEFVQCEYVQDLVWLESMAFVRADFHGDTGHWSYSLTDRGRDNL